MKPALPQALPLLLLVLSTGGTELRAEGGAAVTGDPVVGAASKSPGESAGHDRGSAWRLRWQQGLRYDWVPRSTVGATNQVSLTQLPEEAKLDGKIGGMVQLDAATFTPEDSAASFDDAVELRRARLYTAGRLNLRYPISYKVQVGYVDPEWEVYDLYVEALRIPGVRAVRLGYFKVPMTLSGYGSPRDTLMMETASPIQAFYPEQRLGVQTGGPELQQRFTWAAGVFSTGEGLHWGDASEGAFRTAARVTGVPLSLEGAGQEPRLVHLGLSASYSRNPAQSQEFRSRPESHLAPYLVDTGSILLRDSLLVGAEVAYVHGPYSVQAEYVNAFAGETSGSTLHFGGIYVRGSWFLTGESRPYDRARGVFTLPAPRRNLSLAQGGGAGALELVGTASYLDLSDAGVNGGEMTVLGAGLNWYWNPTVRVQFNYQSADVNGGPTPGQVQILQTRLQLAF